MKILFYCCEFAPEGKTGAIRPSKFAKYFSKYGVNVSILTKSTTDIINLSDIEQLPEGSIERINMKKHLGINDEGIWFTFYSIKRLISIIKQKKIDIIFISVPVFFPLLAVYIANKITGVKYVIDYRDLWYKDPYKPKSLKDKTYRLIGKITEKTLMKNALITTFISEEMAFDQQNEYGKIDNKLILSTGYDDNDIDNIKNTIVPCSLLSKKYQYISHIGMLDWDMNIHEIIWLIKNAKIDKSTKFLFVGGKNDLIKNEFEKLGINEKCIFINTVNKQIALSIAKLSKGLMILGSNSSQRLNRKVFESVAINSNIFYFGNKNSPTAKILKPNTNNIYDKMTDKSIVLEAFNIFCNTDNKLMDIPDNILCYEKSVLSKKYIDEIRRKYENSSSI